MTTATAPEMTPDRTSGSTKISFTLPARLLKGMSVFSSTEEQRFSLKSVLLDYTTKHPVLVATDGRRFGAYSLKEYQQAVESVRGKQLMIPSSIISKIPSTLRVLADLDVTIDFDDAKEMVQLLFVIKGEARRPSSGTIIGTFPRWRKIIPSSKTAPFRTLVLNGDYVADFQHAGNILRADDNPPSYPIFTADDTKDAFPASYTVRLSGVPEFLGVCMGVRIDEEIDYKVPDFVKCNLP